MAFMSSPTRQPAAAPAFTSDAERWEAVRTRDARADGAFFYSVRTTGVYCRPSCAARLARRENVAFHESTEAAERAGFRPCKRCRPNEAALVLRQAAAIADACRRIEAAETPPSLAELAEASGMSRFHFHRLFKRITGVTPRAYAAAHRAARVREELGRSDTVTSALYNAGFNSNGRFYAASDAVLGMTPTRYREGGAGERIRFAIGRCSLGDILVAATARGVCAILLGDDPEALIAELEERFPKAELVGGDAGFERDVAKVVGLVEAPGRSTDLPLDVRGTAFQRRVWEALCAIPPGSTASYAEIAERIGAPKSIRAVAQACAANALAVAIPCHRVVRQDGGLAGYRWGVEKKRALLEREGAA